MRVLVGEWLGHYTDELGFERGACRHYIRKTDLENVRLLEKQKKEEGALFAHPVPSQKIHQYHPQAVSCAAFLRCCKSARLSGVPYYK